MNFDETAYKKVFQKKRIIFNYYEMIDLHACMHTSFRPSINSKVQINRGRHLHSGIKHKYIKLLVDGA